MLPWTVVGITLGLRPPAVAAVLSADPVAVRTREPGERGKGRLATPADYVFVHGGEDAGSSPVVVFRR
ncbi:hypothetical protein GCM10010191_07740 [Actinomadura vinacea]|uniref:Uncharacterized protein n=1 Tax=Actinomadura vinacea TaxID=115336 RepID=A0ABN3IEL5_9ACTN